MSHSLRPHESQHARPPCPSPTLGVYPNPCPSSRWCHPAISSSVIPFSSCPQSFPALWSFPMTLTHGPNILGSYAILLFTALDLASITSHIHNWVLFLLLLHPFFLSGVISPLISSSILGTYRPGEFLFQCPIFLPFHTVHGVLKARILKGFASPFSSEPHSVRPLHHDPPILGDPTQHGLVSLS